MALKFLRFRKKSHTAALKQPAEIITPVEDAPGIPSKYIFWFKNFRKAHPNVPFVLVARVSSRDQHRKGQIRPQCWNLYESAINSGAKIIKVFEEVGSGSEEVANRLIMVAAKCAKWEGACLLVESVARLLRSPKYSFFNQDQQPTDAELKAVVTELDVPISTLLHPDASPEETRAFETMRGLRYSKAKSGRPRKRLPGYKRKIRDELHPIVMKLHNAGESYRKIEAKTGIKVSTARGWILAQLKGVRIPKQGK